MKLKAFIITIHHIYNYGSALQSYALLEYLHQNGVDAEIINYQPTYDYSIIRKVKDLILKLMFNYKYYARYKRYKKFHKDNLRLKGRPLKTTQDLEALNLSNGILISGSDQIWNPYFLCGKDSAYTLGFSSNASKISYASSLGRDNLSLSELENLSHEIRGYKWVSVREQSGVSQLEKVGINAVHVCDPVFLLPKSIYERVEIQPSYSDYILAYSVHTSQDFSSVVDALKKKLNLKVVMIGDFLIRFPCDIYAKDCGPLEFLGLVHKAKFVVTNSFHCTSFAMIYQKEFLTVMPDVNSERIKDILKISGLEDRCIFNSSDLHRVDFSSMINYEEAGPKLAGFTVQSSRLLREQINKLSLCNSGEEIGG